MPIYPINFNGYTGTVEVSDGTLKLEMPPTIASGTIGNASFQIKRYYLSLVTPDRKYIEFEPYRFAYGEWLDWYFLSIGDSPLLTSELKEGAKKEIEVRGT